jgi:histidine ammonia-lyase
MPLILSIDGQSLTIAQVAEVARQSQPVALTPEARARMTRSHAWVERLSQGEAPIYGLNTGFGVFADRHISAADTARLQRNLLLSHAVGLGPPFAPDVVRAAMLIRANTLALGHSGVRPALVDSLLAMLNAGLTPIIPSLGSLGSSGDLAPLSHLALVLSTDEPDGEAESGQVWHSGEAASGKAAMAAAGIPRLVLGPKESLALNNGATFSTALGALAVADARQVLAAGQTALALSLEALRAAPAAFDARLHAARGHPGQQRVAAQVRALIAGSTLIGAAGRVQDAYSLRCAPQVLGPVAETLEFVATVIERELNAATDNPLLLDGQAVSGGNFHGEAVGLALDYLGIALTEVGALAERRVARLLDENLNDGLPAMLVGDPANAGLHSGLMMLQYTAAALVLENGVLATPSSVRSLPTSANQEDHNANSANAARHLAQIVEHTRRVVAIELFAAAQAVDLRLRASPGACLGAGTARAHALIRQTVPFIDRDQLYAPFVEALVEGIRSETFDLLPATLKDEG